MSDNEIAETRVIAVLLADGWHQIVPGSFSVGPLDLGVGADLDLLGFRFAEADAGRPYQPTMLAGSLDSIIAVRQVSSAVRRIGHQDRALAPHNGQTHNGHRADQGARLRVHAVR
jgi:hypothetical protein